MLSSNGQLVNVTSEYEPPNVIYGTIEVDGVRKSLSPLPLSIPNVHIFTRPRIEMNYKEIRPPRMDDSGRTKYPVLFRVYGGPGSQMVHTRFDMDWHSYLVCSLKYVVVVVDGRGTGFKGRALRNPIRGNMGFWETKDQIEAAK